MTQWMLKESLRIPLHEAISYFYKRFLAVVCPFFIRANARQFYIDSGKDLAKNQVSNHEQNQMLREPFNGNGEAN